MAFPSIPARWPTVTVFAVIDASGTHSKMAQEITLARIVQAGVVPMDAAAVASELQQTWNRADAMDWAAIYTRIFPAYQLLIESYTKAQTVANNKGSAGFATLIACQRGAAAPRCSLLNTVGYFRRLD